MENAIKIQVPISVSYTALEGVLKKQMLGEYIPRPEKGSNEEPYAQILDIGITGSRASDYDVVLRIKIRILRTVLKRDEVDLLVMANLGYDNTAQHLFVRNFKLDSRTGSGFFNASLEMLANKVAYNQIIKRTRFNISQIISKEVKKANGLLDSGLDLKGVKLKGALEKLWVQDITAHMEGISLSLELEANIEAEVFDLLSLMPPK